MAKRTKTTVSKEEAKKIVRHAEEESKGTFYNISSEDGIDRLLKDMGRPVNRTDTGIAVELNDEMKYEAEVLQDSGTISEQLNMKDMSNPKDVLGIKKPSISLIPPCALLLESEAFKDGATKYGPYNYRKTKVRATVYIDAAFRHLVSYLDGETKTRDTGIDHRAAVRACMAILIDAEQTGNLIDDRPTKGTASDLIEQLTEKKS